MVNVTAHKMFAQSKVNFIPWPVSKSVEKGRCWEMLKFPIAQISNTQQFHSHGSWDKSKNLYPLRIRVIPSWQLSQSRNHVAAGRVIPGPWQFPSRELHKFSMGTGSCYMVQNKTIINERDQAGKMGGLPVEGWILMVWVWYLSPLKAHANTQYMQHVQHIPTSTVKPVSSKHFLDKQNRFVWKTLFLVSIVSMANIICSFVKWPKSLTERQKRRDCLNENVNKVR